MNKSFKEALQIICQDSKSFINRYFKVMDNFRNQLSQMYYKDAVIIYDGNCIVGPERIEKFLTDLPRKNHNIMTINAQPVLMDGITPETCLSMLVQVFGTFEYNDNANVSYQFDQKFFLEKRGIYWKILNDTTRVFRASDPTLVPCLENNQIPGTNSVDLVPKELPENTPQFPNEEITDDEIPLDDDNENGLESLIDIVFVKMEDDEQETV